MGPAQPIYQLTYYVQLTFAPKFISYFFQIKCSNFNTKVASFY